MSSNLIRQPYEMILDPTGGGGRAKPVANGKFYVGEIDKDPIANPRTNIAYKDESGKERSLTSPLTLNNSGAFVVSKNDGTIIQPYMKDGVGFSVLITDSRGRGIYSDLNAGDPGNIVEVISEYSDIVFKASGGNSAVDNMVSSFNLNPIMHSVGTIIKTGGTTWDYEDSTGPVTIDNFRPFNVVNINDLKKPTNTWGDAIQSAIDISSSIYIPAKTYTYVPTEPIRLKNNLSIFGDGQHSSVINAEGTGYDDAMFIHEGEGDRAANVTMKNFSIRGGKHSINITSSGCDSWTLENMNLQVTSDYAIVTNQWQVSMLKSVTFYYTMGGFACNGISNMNNFIDCEFVYVDRSCFLCSKSSEVTNFIGCRFEALGQREAYDPARSTIHIVGKNNGTYFTGCYFERTHVKVIREDNPVGACVFRDTHFTGGWNDSDTGSFVPYTFDSEGIITLENNTYFEKTVAPKYANLTGTNVNLDVSNSGYMMDAGMRSSLKLFSPKLSTFPAAGQENLFRLNATASNGTLSDQVIYSGVLTHNVSTVNSSGTIISAFSTVVNVMARRVASGQLSVFLAQVSQLKDDAQSRLVEIETQTLSTRSVYVVARLTGFSDLDNYTSSWTFESKSHSSEFEDSFIAPSLYAV